MSELPARFVISQCLALGQHGLKPQKWVPVLPVFLIQMNLHTVRLWFLVGFAGKFNNYEAWFILKCIFQQYLQGLYPTLQEIKARDGKLNHQIFLVIETTWWCWTHWDGRTRKGRTVDFVRSKINCASCTPQNLIPSQYPTDPERLFPWNYYTRFFFHGICSNSTNPIPSIQIHQPGYFVWHNASTSSLHQDCWLNSYGIPASRSLCKHGFLPVYRDLSSYPHPLHLRYPPGLVRHHNLRSL